MGATNVTGIGEIVAASKISTDGKSPPPTTGYVNLRYEVRVVKWLSGTGPEKMLLGQGVEAETKLPRIGDILFFSACSSADGSAFEPDVGYFFTLDKACRPEVEKLAEKAAKGVTKKPKPRACDTKGK